MFWLNKLYSLSRKGGTKNIILTSIKINYLTCLDFRVFVETTGLHGAGHYVETMDAISQALLLPVKIYLDEIDKLGGY